jgi:hypothetical protein
MRLWLTTLVLLAATFAVASPAGATANQQDSLIYMPYGLPASWSSRCPGSNGSAC